MKLLYCLLFVNMQAMSAISKPNFEIYRGRIEINKDVVVDEVLIQELKEHLKKNNISGLYGISFVKEFFIAANEDSLVFYDDRGVKLFYELREFFCKYTRYVIKGERFKLNDLLKIGTIFYTKAHRLYDNPIKYILCSEEDERYLVQKKDNFIYLIDEKNQVPEEQRITIDSFCIQYISTFLCRYNIFDDKFFTEDMEFCQKDKSLWLKRDSFDLQQVQRLLQEVCSISLKYVNINRRNLYSSNSSNSSNSSKFNIENNRDIELCIMLATIGKLKFSSYIIKLDDNSSIDLKNLWKLYKLLGEQLTLENNHILDVKDGHYFLKQKTCDQKPAASQLIQDPALKTFYDRFILNNKAFEILDTHSNLVQDEWEEKKNSGGVLESLTLTTRDGQKFTLFSNGILKIPCYTPEAILKLFCEKFKAERSIIDLNTERSANIDFNYKKIKVNNKLLNILPMLARILSDFKLFIHNDTLIDISLFKQFVFYNIFSLVLEKKDNKWYIFYVNFEQINEARARTRAQVIAEKGLLKQKNITLVNYNDDKITNSFSEFIEDYCKEPDERQSLSAESSNASRAQPAASIISTTNSADKSKETGENDKIYPQIREQTSSRFTVPVGSSNASSSAPLPIISGNSSAINSADEWKETGEWNDKTYTFKEGVNFKYQYDDQKLKIIVSDFNNFDETIFESFINKIFDLIKDSAVNLVDINNGVLVINIQHKVIWSNGSFNLVFLRKLAKMKPEFAIDIEKIKSCNIDFFDKIYFFGLQYCYLEKNVNIWQFMKLSFPTEEQRAKMRAQVIKDQKVLKQKNITLIDYYKNEKSFAEFIEDYCKEPQDAASSSSSSASPPSPLPSPLPSPNQSLRKPFPAASSSSGGSSSASSAPSKQQSRWFISQVFVNIKNGIFTFFSKIYNFFFTRFQFKFSK